MRILLASLLLMLVLTACSSATNDALPPTMEQLRNATYKEILPQPLTLRDGSFEGEPHMPGSASHDTVTLVPGDFASGDLTGDGVDEAVVGLAWNAGGSGVFFALAIVRNDGGTPDNIATIGLGDRVKVENLSIENGTLIADLVEHGTDDPMCCPTMHVHREWRFENDQLVQTQVSKRAKTGRFTGYLVWGHEARSFTTCDRDREGWVVNEAGEELVGIYESLTSEPYQEMFVEVRGEWQEAPVEGFGADYPEALRITELIRAEGEGFGCDLDLDGVLYVASGNEPFWRLHIRPDGLSMWSMDSPGETKFPPADVVGEDGRVTLNADAPEAGIHIVLEKRRCMDSMSGARHSFAATVAVGGRTFHGCALEGM